VCRLFQAYRPVLLATGQHLPCYAHMPEHLLHSLDEHGVSHGDCFSPLRFTCGLPLVQQVRHPFLVVFLRHATLDQLHAARNFAFTLIAHQQMHMVARDTVIQDAKLVPSARFAKPMHSALPLDAEFEQKRALMAAVRDVPDATRSIVAIRAGHAYSITKCQTWRGQIPELLT